LNAREDARARDWREMARAVCAARAIGATTVFIVRVFYVCVILTLFALLTFASIQAQDPRHRHRQGVPRLGCRLRVCGGQTGVVPG